MNWIKQWIMKPKNLALALTALNLYELMSIYALRWVGILLPVVPIFVVFSLNCILAIGAVLILTRPAKPIT
jgi:hypothetical protein